MTVSRRLGPFTLHWYDGFGYVGSDLPRGRYVTFGRYVIGGWGFHFNKRWDYTAQSERKCDRCGSNLQLQGWRSFTYAWLYCPRCRYRLRTPEQLEATSKEHMAELGMSEAEYTAYCRSLISTEPLSPEQLERAAKRAKDLGW